MPDVGEGAAATTGPRANTDAGAAAIKPQMISATFSLETRGSEALAVLEKEATNAYTRLGDGGDEHRIALRVIGAGRLLRDGPTLGEQGWSLDSTRKGQPLRLTLIATVVAVQRCGAADHIDVVAVDPVTPIRNAAIRLAEEGVADFDLFDAKTGKSVAVPPSARVALITAIVLHAKARGILTDPSVRCAKEAAIEALPYLTAADEAFEQCRGAGGGALVDQSDNFGALQLDIVWDYTILGDVDRLPDALRRLKAAESSLISKFDTNYLTLAELAAEQGKVLAPEVVQMARFLLLRGVAASTSGDRTAARKDFGRARLYFNGLAVDHHAVATLIEMGATQHQAVAALRKAAGSVDMAAHRLLDERATVQKAAEDREAQLALGTTADGSFVDAANVESLCRMGFSKKAVLHELKRSNNETESALMALTSPAHHKVRKVSLADGDDVDETNLAVMLSLGYDLNQATAALRATNNDVAAATALANCGADPEVGVPAMELPADVSSARGSVETSVSDNDVDDASRSTDEDEAEADRERRRLDDEAYYEAREIIEEQLGQALRRNDLGDEMGGSLLDDERALLTLYSSEK
jgi:hypothetical protein